MYKEYLNFAKKVAYLAGDIMLKYNNDDNGANYKYDNTIVTKADTEINSMVVSMVKNEYPTHSVDGEEEQFGQSNKVWVCDPVDGTAMYARHIPLSVFSLALVVDGISVVGVIYDPWTKNLYSAIKDGGAYCNDKPINVNATMFEDKRSVSHYDMFPSSEYNIFDVIKELGQKGYFVSIGSIARACVCVANGSFNVAIFPGTTHKNCDIAAAKIIVEEAGGKVTDLFGNEQRYDQSINGAIVSNSVVHDEVVRIMKKYLKDKNVDNVI